MSQSVFQSFFILFAFALSIFSSASAKENSHQNQLPDTTYIDLKDYGLEKNKKRDCTEIINKALKDINNDVPTVIRFGRGEYHFYPGESNKRNYYESNTKNINPRNCAILFENRRNLVIDGNGCTLIFHEQMQPFTLDNCRNIILKNLSIDWEQPLTAQGKVVKVNDEFIELAIDLKESPYQVGEDGILNFSINRDQKEPWKSTIEFDREGRFIVPQTGNLGCLGKGWDNYVAENIIPGVIRLYYPFLRKPAIGNYLVLQHAQRIHSGIFIQDSKNILVQNVNLYYSPGFGVLAQFSENLTFDGCKAIPNKGKNRYFAGNDGGLQISNCKGHLTVNNCEFAGLMAEPINVSGVSIQVIEKMADNQLKCRFINLQNEGLNWGHRGDSICFIENSTMKKIGTGIIESFKLVDSKTVTVVFKDKIPDTIKNNDALENLTWTPNVLITNSQFKSSWASGIQISVPAKVVIKNNGFESSGSAILITSGTENRSESGSETGILIESNEFTDLCNSSPYQYCEGIISVSPDIKELNEKTPHFYSNIRIINNRFNPFDYPILFARSVDGLAFENNAITRSTRFEAYHPGKYSFTFEACKKVSLNSNTFSEEVLGKNVLLKLTPVNELNCSQPELTIRSVKMAE